MSAYILGVDPGYAKCGWSLVEPKTGRVRALGVIITKQDPLVAKKQLDKSTDRARRISKVSAELRRIARGVHCTMIAAEQALQHGAAAAIAANLLPWGALSMLADELAAPLLEVTAKCWQHAVLDVEAGKVDYEQLAKMLGGFVDGQVDNGLLGIKKENRTHAVDAVGVGVLAAMRPHLARVIVEARTTRTFPVELRKDITS